MTHLPGNRTKAILAQFHSGAHGVLYCKGSGTVAKSTKRREVEIHGNGVAFAGSDLHARRVGLERGRRELNVHDGAGENATSLGARVLRLAGDVLGRNLFVAVEDAVLESAPEFRRAKLNGGRRARARMGRCGNEGAVGLRELNLHLNFDGFVMRFVIESRALGAVVGLPAGVSDEKREGREEGDGSNMRSGFGRGKQLRVLVKERVHRFVATLP